MNTIHDTAVIGAGVALGNDNVIGPYAVLVGRVVIGDGNWIGPHVVVGTAAEIRGIDHGVDLERLAPGSGVELGSGNVVREHATIHQGHYGRTTLGDDCYIMNRAYVAHDCVVSDGVTMASGATLGGHCQVGAGANLGMNATLHQRRVIGPGAMVGMGSVVTRDIPPFALAYGNPCRVRGANRLGLERADVPESAIDEIHRAYAAGSTPARPEDGAMAEAWSWWDQRG